MQRYVVVDTNVLVSALLKYQSIPSQFVQKIFSGEVIPLLCNEIVEEYSQVLNRPKFKFNAELIKFFLNSFIGRSLFVDAENSDEIMPDPKDVVFYEVVMEGRKRYKNAFLVTGNIKHFPTKSFVVTPKEMLDIIENDT